MASTLFKVSLLFKNVADFTWEKTLGNIRGAHKKVTGGRSVSKKGGRPKFYGLWTSEGQNVPIGKILARQYRIRYCAGLNVGYKNRNLFAKVPGKVLITCEETNFDPNNPVVQRSYPDRTVMFKKYIHVIPKPPHQRFNLVNRN